MVNKIRMDELRNEKKMERMLTQMLPVYSEGKIRYGKRAAESRGFYFLRVRKCKLVCGIRWRR